MQALVNILLYNPFAGKQWIYKIVHPLLNIQNTQSMNGQTMDHHATSQHQQSTWYTLNSNVIILYFPLIINLCDRMNPCNKRALQLLSLLNKRIGDIQTNCVFNRDCRLWYASDDGFSSISLLTSNNADWYSLRVTNVCARSIKAPVWLWSSSSTDVHSSAA